MTEPEDKPTCGQPASPEGEQQPESPDAGQQAAAATGGAPDQAGAASGAQGSVETSAPEPAQDAASGVTGQQPDDGQAPPPPPSPYADELPQAAAQPYAAPYGQPYPAYPAYPAQDGTQPYAACPTQDGTGPYGQAYVPPAFPDATSPYGQAPNPYQQPPYPGQPAGSPAPDGANPYAQPSQPGMPGAQGTAPQPYQPYSQAAVQQPPYPGQGGYPPYGGQPPYPYQPYPAAPVPPKKRKVWPWVLVAILVVFVLGIGGCVSCVACSVAADRNYSGTYDDTYDYGYGSDSYDSYDYSNGYTLDFIKDLGGSLPNTVDGGQYSPGVYEVGVGKDMEPGLYYLGGSQTTEGEFYVFERMDGGTGYEVTKMVCYFGSYFAQLEDGDVIVYWGADDDSRLCAAAQAPAAPTAPYPSGCYRVGTDIPAGTYTITAQEGASSIEASQEAAAYAMKDLEFGDGSVVDTKYVVPGGTQAITLTDGQYLELYLAVATPA